MKGLTYQVSRVTPKKKLIVTISLADEGNNGYCHFSITTDGYEKTRNGRWKNTFGGCCHDEILKSFPRFADFVALHLSNTHGQPMHAIENGIYHLRQDIEKGAEYLRIPTELAKQLDVTDKYHFRYQLFKLGIIANWKREADEAIKHLETLCGKPFVNPYGEDEKSIIRMSEEEKADIEAKAITGYYSTSAIQAREELRLAKERIEERNKVLKRYDDVVAKALKERDIMTFVFDTFGIIDNVIYYDHKNTLCLNWTEPRFASFNKHWSEEEFSTLREKICRDASNPLFLGLEVERKYKY